MSERFVLDAESVDGYVNAKRYRDTETGKYYLVSGAEIEGEYETLVGETDEGGTFPNSTGLRHTFDTTTQDHLQALNEAAGAGFPETFEGADTVSESEIEFVTLLASLVR